MSISVALLTPGRSAEQSQSLAAELASRLGEGATVQAFDPLSEAQRPAAEQALTTGTVDIAVALEAGFRTHVLPTARVPVVIVAGAPDMLWMAADAVASVRMCGVRASVAASWDEVARIRASLAPSPLAGKKALVFAEPFDSATLPSPNLSREYVMERTGVDVAFRPLEALEGAVQGVDESRAKREMARWMEDATEVGNVSAETVLASCRLYLALKHLVDAEGLSGVSIDCVRYSFSESPVLPHPCLAFSRLRDEGIAAPCEADVCAMLAELLLEGVARKPSFLGNIGAVDIAASTTDLLHCVVPLKMDGYDAKPIPYRLQDYHGLGRGVSMAVDFATGGNVTLGAFSKDLRSFVLWPGALTETGSGFCRCMARVKIPDPERFLHEIAGCHYLMVYGDYVAEVSKALMKMDVCVTGPIAW